jgi:hypothetical protein
MSALIQLRNEPDHSKAVLRVVFSVTGFLFALVWLGFTFRGKKLFTDGWEQWIAYYERDWLKAGYDKKKERTKNADTSAEPLEIPLVFYNIKAHGFRSPIHPDPIPKSANKLRRKLVCPLLDKIGWYNLNLFSWLLPGLFAVAWLTFPFFYPCLK